MKVRASIIGSGFAADLHAEGYEKCLDAELVAVSSPTEEHAKDFASRYSIKSYYTDYTEMLKRDDIDLVSICIPNCLHHDAVIAAAEAGKNIICEKPLATTLDEADDMLKAAEKNGVRIFYGENWLFAPALVRVSQIVRSGAIGKPLYLKAKESHGGSHSKYALSKKYCGGGCLIHMGIHPIGFVLALKEGIKPVRVYADASGGGDNNILHPKCEGEDFALLIIDFEDGSRGLIESDYITKGGLDDVVEIYGTEGTIKANFSQWSPLKVFSLSGYDYAIEKAETTKGWTSPAPDEKWSQGVLDEIGHFVKCLAEGTEPRYGADGRGGRAALEIVMAGYESSNTGRAVEITS